MTEKRVINKRKTKDDIEITEYEETKADGSKSRSANVAVMGVIGKPKANLKNK